MKRVKLLFIFIFSCIVIIAAVVIATMAFNNKVSTSNTKYDKFVTEQPTIVESEQETTESIVDQETTISSENDVSLGNSVLSNIETNTTAPLDMSVTGKLSDCIGYIVVGSTFDKTYLSDALLTLGSFITFDKAIYLSIAEADRETDSMYLDYYWYDSKDGSFGEDTADLIYGEEDLSSRYNLLYESFDNLLDLHK